jgi:hypothetical protein
VADTFPRALSKREAEILALMLDVDEPAFHPLREQARTASVVGRCECGCATIYLAVDRSRGTAADLPSPATDTYTSSDPQDPETFFELILLLDSGWLSSLEIVYYGDTIPTEFPPPIAFERPHARWRA